ncbi:MAG: hypothetical protein JXJ22_05330 [Bacteroidales bacterium]|nr:hypothetical protein [Bacteroidales bacterium]
MARKEQTNTRRRLRSAYITSTISISLVLFMLGLIGLLLLNTKRLSDYVKENIGFTIFLNDDVKEADILHLQKTLDAKHYVKETKYITKEQAAIDFQEELGEDFIEVLEFNPLTPSIDVKLYAEYANTDSISKIEVEFQKFAQIKEVAYQESLIHLVNENIRKISLVILIFSGLLFLIAVALVNNTIRLSIYSKRFLIRTMQLVGANNGFIRKPFLYKSLILGSLGAFFAILILSGLIFTAQKNFSEIVSFKDYKLLTFLFLLIFIIGIVINWISTYTAVSKYLNIKTDQLYN